MMGVFSKDQSGTYKAAMSPLVKKLLNLGYSPIRIEQGVWKIGHYQFKSGWKIREDAKPKEPANDHR